MACAASMLPMHQSREAHHTAPLHYSPEGLAQVAHGIGRLQPQGRLGAAVALHGIEEGCIGKCGEPLCQTPFLQVTPDLGSKLCALIVSSYVLTSCARAAPLSRKPFCAALPATRYRA